MASVRKRTWTHKGVEREAWVVSYTDQDGKRRLKTFEKKKQADAFRQKVEAEINLGIHTAASASITVEEGVREYVASCEHRRRLGDMSGYTVNKARYTLEQHLAGRLGKRILSELTSDDFQGYVDDLLAKGYGVNTVAGCYRDAAKFLKFAQRRKWVKRSVLVDEPCRVPAYEPRTAVPSKADIQKLVDCAEIHVKGEMIHTPLVRAVAIMLGIFGGLRPGETFGLQWEDVDRAGGVIRVRHSHSRWDGLKTPKTRAGMRVVPLTPPIEQALDRLASFSALRARVIATETRAKNASDLSYYVIRDWQKPGAVYGRIEDMTGYVLLTREKRPYTPPTFANIWWPMMENLELVDPVTGKPKFSLHALRHAAASLWIEAGLPDLHLKTVLGHASVSTTYNVYGHIFPEDRALHQIVGGVAAKFGRRSTESAVALD